MLGSELGLLLGYADEATLFIEFCQMMEKSITFPWMQIDMNVHRPIPCDVTSCERTIAISFNADQFSAAVSLQNITLFPHVNSHKDDKGFAKTQIFQK